MKSSSHVHSKEGDVNNCITHDNVQKLNSLRNMWIVYAVAFLIPSIPGTLQTISKLIPSVTHTLTVVFLLFLQFLILSGHSQLPCMLSASHQSCHLTHPLTCFASDHHSPVYKYRTVSVSSSYHSFSHLLHLVMFWPKFAFLVFCLLSVMFGFLCFVNFDHLLPNLTYLPCDHVFVCCFSVFLTGKKAAFETCFICIHSLVL